MRAVEDAGPYKRIPPPSSTSFRASAHTGVGIRFSRRPASTGMDGLPRRCAPRNDVHGGGLGGMRAAEGVGPYKEPGHVSLPVSSRAKSRDLTGRNAERNGFLDYASLRSK